MSEKVTKYTVTDVKSVVCSFFAKISHLSGGGGSCSLKGVKTALATLFQYHFSGINPSLRRNFFSWRDGFFKFYFPYKRISGMAYSGFKSRYAY